MGKDIHTYIYTSIFSPVQHILPVRSGRVENAWLNYLATKLLFACSVNFNATISDPHLRPAHGIVVVNIVRPDDVDGVL